MNLQIVSPYTPCPFKCAYCVSNFEGEYQFEDLYHSDKTAYLSRLRGVLRTAEEDEFFTGAVFTGLTDPSLFPDWVEDVKKVLAEFNLKETTFQTSNYQYRNTEGLTVIAYSIGHRDKIKYLPKREEINENVILRFNIMLSKDMTFVDILKLMAHAPYAQYTVKYLAPTSQGHSETDEWIAKNRLELNERQENVLRALDVWIDKTCMDAESRYRVFREDGSLYSSWTDRIKQPAVLSVAI